MALVESVRTEPPEAKRDRVNALKLGCALWLSEKGFFPFFEVQLDEKRHLRADIYAINNKFEAVVVEVKSSFEDFASDDKWRKYLPYCSKFFFAADWETIDRVRKECDSDAIGYLTLKEWGDITPYSVVELNQAGRVTFGVFADPKFLLRLVKSNCLFIKGLYRGLRKVDKSLVLAKYDMTKQYESKLLDVDMK